MEQRTKIRRTYFINLTIICSRLSKQNTKPSKKDTKTYIQAYTQEEGERERGNLGGLGRDKK